MALEPKNNLFTAPFMLNTIDSIGRWLGFTCQGHFVITQKDRLLEELLYLLLKAKHCLTRKFQCGNKKSRPYKNEWQLKSFFSPPDKIHDYTSWHATSQGSVGVGERQHEREHGTAVWEGRRGSCLQISSPDCDSYQARQAQQGHLKQIDC